jgi:Na+/H+ antiporter NhaD/arsenite permease-like protein
VRNSREFLLNILTFALICVLVNLVFEGYAIAAESAVHAHGVHDIGTELPVWTALPFAGILLSIALCPLLIPHFWHNHFGKISAFWALLFAVPFLFTYHKVALHHILHIYLIDYIPFIILLWGLFTIAGGIVVRGSLKGTPIVNTVMLLIGTILASCVGTTGAAMVMIRPVLRANRDRMKKTHIICFFIFLVANIGGSLTPLGDPPLFLGFLHNVPFFWVTTGILPHMLTASGILLAMFFVIDTLFYRKEKKQVNAGSVEEKISLKIEGIINFVFLAGVIILVLMSGYWKPGHLSVIGVNLGYQSIVRDLGIITMGVLSLVFTSKLLREANDFSWFPIMEVAKLFAGIFMTIIPALVILKAGNDGALSGLVSVVKESYHYFWITGALSSFLDNAPTYLTFFNLALGKLGITEAMVPGALAVKAATANPEFIMYLKAISTGAVFMGANTYIGNAPNFMVKSIAEEAGINMPSFFGYMIKYSIPILIPVFILVTLIFF